MIISNLNNTQNVMQSFSNFMDIMMLNNSEIATFMQLSGVNQMQLL